MHHFTCAMVLKLHPTVILMTVVWTHWETLIQGFTAHNNPMRWHGCFIAVVPIFLYVRKQAHLS